MFGSYADETLKVTCTPEFSVLANNSVSSELETLLVASISEKTGLNEEIVTDVIVSEEGRRNGTL